MTILLFGGTGNLSADCAALIHTQGHGVQIMTRGHNQLPPEYTAFRADRKDLEALRRVVDKAKPDVVVDFIAYDLEDVRIAYECLRGRVRQYVFISSATVYRKPPQQLPITEDTPLGNPYWDYAQRKIACEHWLRARWEQDCFPVTIVRPSHTYSRRWVPNPVSSSSFTFARRIELGLPVFVPDDGESLWTLTASTDFAAGLAGLLGRADTLGQAFHITSDEALSWNQIVREIADALGVSEPRCLRVPTDLICRVVPQLTGNLKGDKAHPAVFDNTRIKRFVPGFRCRVPFRVGVRESVAWLRSHPEHQNLNPAVDAMCKAVAAASAGRR